MGNTDSAFFHICGSKAKKSKKGADKGDDEDEEDENAANKNCDDVHIIRRNKDRYFSKEDYEKIMQKYPAFKEWIDQSENPQAIEKPKRRKIRLNTSRFISDSHIIDIRFEELKIIGHGSCGRVFMGFDSDKGCIMAVKQVHLGDSVGPDQQEKIDSLETEINLLSMFSHKNIVKYYGSHRSENTLNIYLEYVSGGSIASLVQKYGPIPENLIRVYTLQILEGLEYLHIRNTIHRDIKGANILVDSTGVCKLADFGTAKRISSLVESDTKGISSIKGTVNWMAPEIISQSSLGRFCDIWSVGCTVLEMATGKAPWSTLVKPNSTLVGTLYQIAKAKSPPPLPNNLSAVAIDFLKQCFKINPNERPNVIGLLQHKFVTGIQSICRVIEQSYEEREPLCSRPTPRKAAAYFTIKEKRAKSIEQKVQSQKEGSANTKSRELQAEAKYKETENAKQDRTLVQLDNNKKNTIMSNNLENKYPVGSKRISVIQNSELSKTDSQSKTTNGVEHKPISQISRPLGRSPRAMQIKKKGYAKIPEEKVETVNKTVKENISPENIKGMDVIDNFEESNRIEIEIKDSLLKSSESQEKRKSMWWSQCINKSHEDSRREIPEEKDMVEIQCKIFQNKDEEASCSRDSDHESISSSRVYSGNKGLNMSSKLSVMKDSYVDGRGDMTHSEYNMSILRKRERNEKKVVIITETPTVELSIVPNYNLKPNQEANARTDQKVDEVQGKESFDLRKYNMSEDLNRIFPKFEANSSPLAF